MLIVFDFDGVLADPVLNIATIAHKAYCKLYPKLPLDFLLAAEGKNLKCLTRQKLLGFLKKA